MEKKITIHMVENAFQPAKEVSDAERFAGRTKPLEESFYALMTDGASIAIVGNRGIGKTSLSRQIQNIAAGDNDILQKVGLHSDHNFDFFVAYHACGDGTKNIDDLLSGILTREKGLGSWLYWLPKTSKMIGKLDAGLSAKIFGTGVKLSGSEQSEQVTERITVPSTTQGVFENVCTDIVDSELSKDGLLIIIDEFDQIKNPAGFAPFLKALATNTSKIKFCIVGVAKDIQDLMKEHASSDRLFSGSVVTLDPMSPEELDQIISIAENQLYKTIVFDQSARQKIISLAAGHPYMVHLIGKFALRQAFKNGNSSITKSDIDDVLTSIAQNKSDPLLEGRYRTAIVSSKQREGVLKALVKHQDDKGEILTTDAYKSALDDGIENASHYVGQLVTVEYGAEIEKIRERHYRFKDSLFAAYVSARPPMRGAAFDEQS